MIIGCRTGGWKGKKKEIEEGKKDGGRKEEKGRVGKGRKEGWKKKRKETERGEEGGGAGRRLKKQQQFSVLTPSRLHSYLLCDYPIGCCPAFIVCMTTYVY